MLLPRTLDYQASHSEEADLVRDVKGELEGNMKTLQKGKGEKGRVWGKERGKVWEEVRELRKEWVVASDLAQAGLARFFVSLISLCMSKVSDERSQGGEERRGRCAGQCLTSSRSV